MVDALIAGMVDLALDAQRRQCEPVHVRFLKFVQPAALRKAALWLRELDSPARGQNRGGGRKGNKTRAGVRRSRRA